VEEKITVPEALQRAIRHHQTGQLADAERCYRAILQAQPQHPDANHNLGVLAVGLGKPEAALPFFKVALDANPKIEQFWASYANGLLQAGQADNVRQLILLAQQHGHTGAALQQIDARLAQAASLAPIPDATPSVPLEPAVAAREAGHYSAAITWLDEWLAAHPEDVSALALLAQVLLLNKQESRATSVLAQAQTLAPEHPAVQRNLARLALKRNQPGAALEATQHALLNDPNNPESWLIHAVALGANLRDTDALPLIERTLQALPDYAEAWANRALIRLRAKDKAGALADIEKALALKPHLAQCWQIAASLQYEARNLPGAIDAMQRALELEPGNVGFMVSLGEFLRQNYQSDAAIAMLEHATSIAPNHSAAWTNLGTALHGAGHLEKARHAYETALRLKPDQAEVAHNLGAMAKDAESWDAALKYFEQALAYSPNHVQFLASKGLALLSLRRPPEEVEKVAQKIFAVEPGHEAGLQLLGSVCLKLGRLTDAASYFRKVLDKTPNSAQANAALGGVLKDMDELPEAETYLRRALELNPTKLSTLSDLLFTCSYLAHHSSAYRLGDAKRFGAIASSKATQRMSHACAQTPPRLRVGLVSGDLRNHPVGYFLEGFLPHIDRARIEIVAYPTYSQTDELTERLRPNFAAWVPLHGQSDAAAATQIAADGIHVLLDLSGHTAHNRLPLFAFKPAPVQASWLGYFATTGVEQMDYVLADPYIAPPDEENHFTEHVWRLPESYMCMSPPAIAVELAPLPALSAGHLAFGCFNNLTKMNDAVVALWARVLLAVPSARLLLKTKQLADEKIRQRTYERFAAKGIAADRLVLEGPSARAELLAAYHRVDIALDPFPYPGGTTSAEALWMGVPVLTRQGDCFLSHVGETIAYNAGQANWIARDDADYVAKAVAFASDLSTLARLRAGLRAQVLASPLFDAERFAKNVEAALWGMWQQRTSGEKGSDPDFTASLPASLLRG